MRKKLITILLPLIVLFACLGFTACGRPDRLSAPENLKIENGILCWDNVKHADGYEVYINGEKYQTKECRFDLTGLDETQIYAIEVMAYDNGGILSFYSDIAYVGKYAVPTQGLEYHLSNMGGSPHFFIDKFSADENGACIVPAAIDGIPVTDFYMPTYDLPQIKTLVLPACIEEKTLGKTGNYMSQFPNLETFILGEGNENFISEGNCLIDKRTNRLVMGCIGCEIPNYVTEIGNSAFAGRSIQSFIAPEQITKIGIRVFFGCKNLKTAVLPERIENMDLSYLFGGCRSLTEAAIPEGAQNLKEAFYECGSLKNVTLPDSVTYMNNTFYGCVSLKTVTIPSNVKEMNSTFSGCASLESVVVPSNVKKLIGAFSYCTSLKSAVLEEGVEEINYIGVLNGGWLGSFIGCTSLIDIRLPSSLKKIGGAAFSGCVSLKSIDIPNSVDSIEPEAFKNCISLKTVQIPKELKYGGLGHTAFSGCVSLKSIEISDGVKKIAQRCFDGCLALTSVVLPKNINIQVPAFEDCPLEAVYYRGTEAEWEENSANINTKYNSELLSAVRYYYSETAPALNAEGTAYEGNFWRYENGVPTVWEYQA